MRSSASLALSSVRRVYAEVYPVLARTLEPIGKFGKITFADATHASPWWFIAALAAVSVVLFAWLESRERRSLVK
jgi:hypothetical protein